MEVHKLVLEAYRRKFLSKEQLTEIQQFKSKNPSPEALSEMIFQRGFLSKEQWTQLQPTPRSTAIQVIVDTQNTPQMLAPKELQECLELFSGGTNPHSSLLNTLFANRYQIKSLLGEGGMGTVYGVDDQKLQREVALKLIKFGHQTPEAQKRFFKEARAIAKMEHPNIIRIYEVDEDPQPYFTMEYVRGETLSSALQKKGAPFSSKESAQLTKKLAQALAYIHQKNIFHLDIKPSNVLLTESREPKLMDFGLAQETEHKLSKISRIAGTPSYISPEQVLGVASQINARTDIYLLGGTLYEMLTGKPPFSGTSANHIYYQVLSSEPIRPRQRSPQIHPDLEAICLKALEKEQLQRYASANELAQDLDHFLEHRPVIAVLPNRWIYLKKWIGRNKSISMLILCFLVLSFSLGGYFQWRHYQTLQKQYYSALQRATEALEKTQSFQETTDLTQQLQSLFRALNAVNEALQIKPFYRSAEEKKWQIAEQFLAICLKTQNYDTAEYIANEIQSLQFLSDLTKSELQKNVDLAKTQQLREHQQSLEIWVDRLQEKSGNTLIRAGDREEFIFEVSQMKEKEILQRLLSLLEEGKIYFLQSKRTVLQDYFFLDLVQVLGRLGNTQASEPLRKVLDISYQTLLKDSSKNKDINYIQWMSSLTKALCQLKDVDSAVLIQTIRHNPEMNTLFNSNLHLHLYSYHKILSALIHRPAQSVKERHTRGVARLDYGDLEGAIADFSQEIQEIQEYSNRADAYCNRGLAWMRKSEWAQANNDFTEAIRLQPKFFGAYNNRGLVRLETEDFQGAIADFSEVIVLDAHFSPGFNNRGLAKFKSQDFQGAIADYTQAILFNDHYLEAYLQRGISRFILKQYKEAIEDYTTALNLSPNNANVYYNRGNVKDEFQDWEGAIQDYTIAIHLDSNQVKAYLNLAILKEKRNDWLGAIRDYTEAIRIKPQALFYYNRACCQFALGNLDEALNDTTEAIYLNPQYGEAYLNRGLLRRDKGDFAGMIADWEYGLSLQSNPEVANELVTLLLRQAKVQILKKEYESARDSLIRAQKYLSPDDPRRPSLEQKCQELTQQLLKKD
ncbi:MAG: protein kinase [Planctomycetota bacterium]